MVICVVCSNKNEDIYIDGSIMASKTTAKPGEVVELTVNIRNTSMVNYYWVYSCLIDNQTGENQTSPALRLEPVPLFGTAKDLIQYKHYYTMKNVDVALAISIIEESSNTCQATGIINLYADTGTGVHNECIAGTCIQKPGAGANQCPSVGLPCTGTGAGVVCSANDMNVMGICVPKPIVLGAFVLGAILIFKK